MRTVARSVAMAADVHVAASGHLIRADGQEDLCFALWHPSQGARRHTALIHRLIMPRDGDREVHGDVSFYPQYLERAIDEARRSGSGLALLHSHPKGRGWQGMSENDVSTEQSRAVPVFAATGLPFLGLTIAGKDQAWSARFWERVAPRTYNRHDCGTVRVVGERLAVTYCDSIVPAPEVTDQQVRTVSAWGEADQSRLARLRVGVVGAGSVGGFIAEALARTGIQDVVVLDFDRIEAKNLDRLVYADRDDIGKLKAETLASRLREVATAASFDAQAIPLAVYEGAAFREVLDSDVIFSCVDRPWGRQVLNLIAYAHLIPVIDGGIAVGVNRKHQLARADWRAHVATVGHRCLECLGQYDPGLVQMERQGLLDSPSYLDGLGPNHPLNARQNVFGFSMACASLQFLQMISLVVAPLGLSNPGAQLYHFVHGRMEYDPKRNCEPSCLFPSMVAQGDRCPFTVTGVRRDPTS